MFILDVPKPTIGIDFGKTKVERDGEEVTIQVWDTPGEERFRSKPEQWLGRCRGVMLVYDILNEDSFKILDGSLIPGEFIVNDCFVFV